MISAEFSKSVKLFIQFLPSLPSRASINAVNSFDIIAFLLKFSDF